jgi:hypothetical protein
MQNEKDLIDQWYERMVMMLGDFMLASTESDGLDLCFQRFKAGIITARHCRALMAEFVNANPIVK